MTPEEIGRGANDLSEQTVSKLMMVSKAMASNKTAMNLIAKCCPPGVTPTAFATAMLIGMAIADEFQETHGMIIKVH